MVAEGAAAAFLVVGIGYNVAMTFNAEDGLRMKSALNAQIVAEREELAALEARRDDLSDKADRLMSASLDQDLLEERVRAVLGLVRPGEYMVRMEDLDRLALAPAPAETVLELAEQAPLEPARPTRLASNASVAY